MKYWFYSFIFRNGSGNGTLKTDDDLFDMAYILSMVKKDKPEVDGVTIMNFFEISEAQAIKIRLTKQT